MRVVIIGAGVAGCVVARGLNRMPGLEIHCLERVEPGDHAESGTGLNIGPNAVQALRATDPELAGLIDEASLEWKNWRVSLTDGTILFDLPLNEVSPSNGWRLRWSELYRVLRESAEGLIRYGCTVEEMGKTSDGSGKTFVRWSDKDGAHELTDIDLLIAVDGRFSQTRNIFAGGVNSRQIGVAIFRTLIPDTSDGLITDYEQWFNGPNRLLAYRVPPGYIYIAGTFPIAKEGETPDELKTPEALRAAYTPRTAPPGDQAKWMIDTICSPDSELHWARIQESEARHCEPDVNVLYLGDSSNGMVPTLGQGATQAIEGACAALAAIESRMAAGDTDVRNWLTGIEASREDRIRFVMDFSLEASDTLLAGSDPVEGTLKKRSPAFLEKLKRLYNDIGTIGSAHPEEERAAG
ncbi:hypothetical protein [Roseibium sp.]|uniref:hypothetical protein n=1 Tax=Roseibium sp. TaxID=1936156 RepID=UPI003A985109